MDAIKMQPVLRTLLHSTAIVSLGFCLADCLAQSPGETEQAQSPSTAEYTAEHDKIWNSKEMLEARAHLKTTFERSAKISQEQADKYMADLKAMSPDELQVWLINFQEQRASTLKQVERERQIRQQTLASRSPAQQVGGFRNPSPGRGTVSSGLPAGTGLQPAGGSRNVFASSPQVQKPFSSPAYQQSVRPLVTSEDAARTEILRGFSPFIAF
ncbi:hypothetical protein [Bythopirellula polymerisocia]|uniref:Uncharacterized protein n=1 Tax=Bythopirellula polymerisocia TaxID=2528003 RepID=A0A5C6CQT7_9BACT|nr:hypothetical protein [Bythopirellula polymerisocia]TWU27283.1 hypothetical protein Pla144_20550 [Bythopirellula polymerisocia]